jgi:tRNA (guanine-N7-)-methyltransferase
MSRKNKLQKFADVLSFRNVVENFDFLNPKLTIGIGEDIDLKGKWKALFFKNENPLILELACGRGEYTVALAKSYPNINFLGVDVKGSRIWKGAKSALDFPNAGFLRTRIEQISLFFDSGEVDEIWITFPDPFIFKERNRLTHHNFLNLYAQILKPGAIIHLKTDDATLYKSSLESFNSWNHGTIVFHDDDIYSKDLYIPELIHKTYYEELHQGLGKTIKYIQFKFQPK